ncbi:hypothetical protein ACIPK7_26120 [Pseudomonas sp. NPDC086581]|uniref:hypothetical protein n=1 Tax=Pseudomonas sp. NPDC086581 TaxID=3364432 RepID=UPI003814D514
MAIILLLVGLAQDVAASQLIMDSENPLSISFSDNNGNKSINIPEKFFNETDEVYTKVHLEKIDSDDIDEVVMTLDGETNSCFKVYRYDRDSNLLVEIKFRNGDICNYRKEGNYLVSSYRAGAAWREDIYYENGHEFQLRYEDVCIGCGEVSRIEFGLGGEESEYLVTDREDFKDRNLLMLEVSSRKAKIYRESAVQSGSNKYLIKGDRVQVMRFSTVGDIRWANIK